MKPLAQASTTKGVSTDASAFEAGVLDFAGKLRAFVRKRVANADDAEDIAQEVFLKVFRSRGALRDPRKLEAWLYQTARGAVIDHYRKRRSTEEIPETLPDEVRAFNEVSSRLSRSVRRFLQTLPQAYRKPLEMAEIQGKSVAEIAKALSLSETAVKSRLARGREMLRKKLVGCCQFEFDGFGKVIDFVPRGSCSCDDSCSPPARRSIPRKQAPLPPLDFALAVESDGLAILRLLKQVKLPLEDLIDTPFLNFVTAKSGGKLLGCAGLEPYGTKGLLRSVAILSDLQGLGLGARLVKDIERLAGQLGLDEIYLLTTTAPDFFKKHGYQQMPRDQAPAEIRESAEFSTICPASAVLMRKAIAKLG